MNANNATYDVLWGVPDGAGLNCSASPNHPHAYLPTCVNTSFPGYAGSWTMAGGPGGLRTGTSYDKNRYLHTAIHAHLTLTLVLSHTSLTSHTPSHTHTHPHTLPPSPSYGTHSLTPSPTHPLILTPSPTH